MNFLVSYIEYYLPVFIPLFLTIISVLAGIFMKRIDLSMQSLLKVHTDMVIGLFSFIIWALVTYQQTGSIALNKDYELSLIRVVLLLFTNIFLLIAGQIILGVKWPQGFKSGANALFLGATIVVVFAPILLQAPIKRAEDEQSEFAIAIPYLDKSLATHIGSMRWDDRLLTEVSYETAPNRETAVKRAITRFRDNEKALQLFSTESVRIENRKIVACEQ